MRFCSSRLGELSAHVVAREIDDLHPELPPMLEEELEEPIRLEMLGDGHHRGDT